MSSKTVLRTSAAVVFGVLGMVACAITLLSTIRSNEGWIRVLDFPRYLEFIAICLVAIGCAAFLGRCRRLALPALLLAAAWHAWRIYPYVPFAPQEVVRAGKGDGIGTGSCFSAFGLNVLQPNRDFRATLNAIEREQPDLLLLMETDGRWQQALAPLLNRYPYRLLRPIDNKYGMIFATRLPVQSAKMVNTTDQNTPTLYARLTTADGQAFNYIGLHPRPPLPGQSTDRRDAKIERAALAVRDGQRLPAVAMGDFNDVPWSHTTQLFKKVGRFLDPRIGRGSYPTFPADYAAVGWPLDQLFVTPEFTFRDLRVLENVGSDHRPLSAQLCLRRRAIAGNGQLNPVEGARAKARNAVDAVR